jgi:hypothetical protein
MRRQQADTDLQAGEQFALRILRAADAAGPVGAAPPRQLGQPVQRRAGAAEVIQQGTKGARADIVRADQPQPIDPRGVAEIGRSTDGVDHM